jgi:hypothetical protein
MARPVTICNENCWLAVCFVGLVESVTVMVTANVPVDAVVPLMVPELEPMLRPEGSPLALQVKGAVPLDAAMVALYPVFITPVGNGEVEIAKAGAIDKESTWVAL